VALSLDVASVPALPGALECIAAGHLSSLHGENALALALVANAEALACDARWPLLCDPQTAGGLLAGVPAAAAAGCVAALRGAGCAAAAVVGRVLEGPGGAEGGALITAVLGPGGAAGPPE
jgi:selenide, water dikinase